MTISCFHLSVPRSNLLTTGIVFSHFRFGPSGNRVALPSQTIQDGRPSDHFHGSGRHSCSGLCWATYSRPLDTCPSITLALHPLFSKEQPERFLSIVSHTTALLSSVGGQSLYGHQVQWNLAPDLSNLLSCPSPHPLQATCALCHAHSHLSTPPKDSLLFELKHSSFKCSFGQVLLRVCSDSMYWARYHARISPPLHHS